MLHCYGENSFTFLLFQELQASGGLIDPLLANLKQFSDGRKFSDKLKPEFNKMNSAQEGEPEVWLFPNFGKRHGFGEPDALVLYGGHTFWFEVETIFNLKNRKSSARAAINQLFRFHYFNRVLAEERTRRTDTGKNHWALMGPTINGKGEVKPAILRVAGHKVLKQIEPQLIDAAQNNRDHYVLLTERKPQQISSTTGQPSALQIFFDQARDEIDNEMKEWSKRNDSNQKPSRPNIQRFWYQYYNGDLTKKKVNIEGNNKKYVSISSSRTTSKKNR